MHGLWVTSDPDGLRERRPGCTRKHGMADGQILMSVPLKNRARDGFVLRQGCRTARHGRRGLSALLRLDYRLSRR